MIGLFFVDAFSPEQGEKTIANAYSGKIQGRLAESIRFLPPVYSKKELMERQDALSEVDLLFSTWGMPSLTEAEVASCFPNVKAVFYAAGSVQVFARPFLNRNIRIFSAAAANAKPVAEYAASQILLANKGFFSAARRYREQGHPAARTYSETMPGNFGTKVGILGAGAIGRQVIRRLRDADLELLVFDPFLPEESARELGVEKAGLDRIFAECQTISNHLANNSQTAGILNYALFSHMKPNAVFLNTGRGAQVVESDLVRALKEEKNRCAVLDVTDPEPVEEGHPFYRLPNIFLTPHIAGSSGGEVGRMGEYMAEAFAAFSAGEICDCEVTLPMLSTMA